MSLWALSSATLAPCTSCWMPLRCLTSWRVLRHSQQPLRGPTCGRSFQRRAKLTDLLIACHNCCNNLRLSHRFLCDTIDMLHVAPAQRPGCASASL